MRALGLNEILNLNDRCISRTVMSGSVSAEASKEKRGSIGDAAAVSSLVERNRDVAVRYIVWRCQVAELSSIEILFSLVCISEIVNMGISANSLFRHWPIIGRAYGGEGDVGPEHVVPSFLLLRVPEAVSVTEYSVEERLSIIAEREWELGIGPLHPFADGCGRTSRYFSSFLSLLYRAPSVLHVSRDDYFNRGRLGRSAFVDYYLGLERVEIRLL